MARYRIWVAGWLSAVLALGTAPASAQQGEAPLPAVVVAPAEMVDLRQGGSFAGRLVADQKVDVRARVSGFLEEVSFEEGSEVSAGDVLFVIEEDIYLAAVAEIQGQITAAEAERQLAELEQERTARLVARGTLAQADLDRADAALTQAEGSLARLQAQLDRAELDLSYTRVTAPFDGIVGLSTFDVGALVSPESGALVTLTNLDPMFAEFSVASALLLNLSEQAAAGQVAGEASVSMRLPNGAMHSEPGRLNFIDAEVGRGTDTVLLRAEFANPDGRLLDGALVQILVQQAEGEARLTVPAQSVQRDLAGSFVMVVDTSNTVEQRRVDIGSTEQGLTVIVSGLEEGETVITEGINKVRPGIQVDAATASDG